MSKGNQLIVTPDKEDYDAVEREHGPLPPDATDEEAGHFYRLAQAVKMIREAARKVGKAEFRERWLEVGRKWAREELSPEQLRVFGENYLRSTIELYEYFDNPPHLAYEDFNFEWGSSEAEDAEEWICMGVREVYEASKGADQT